MNKDEPSCHPGLTALELADLAAKLDPGRCRTDANEALRSAFEFYQLACWWVEKNAGRTPLQIAIDALGTSTVDEMLRIIGQNSLEVLEKNKLRFCPTSHHDKVREVLGVKTPRAVRTSVQTWFNELARRQGRSDAKEQCQAFWTHAEHEESDGTKYFAVSEKFLRGIKSLKRETKMKGGTKAIQTTLAQRAKAKKIRTKSPSRKKSQKS